MLGGTTYECGVCPACGENDFWNETECMTCGYTAEPVEDSVESEE